MNILQILVHVAGWVLYLAIIGLGAASARAHGVAKV
jgi:hypothetical protein